MKCCECGGFVALTIRRLKTRFFPEFPLTGSFGLVKSLLPFKGQSNRFAWLRERNSDIKTF
jgi:hypothetical protein